jgi:hypothetical protein
MAEPSRPPVTLMAGFEGRGAQVWNPYRTGRAQRAIVDMTEYGQFYSIARAHEVLGGAVISDAVGAAAVPDTAIETLSVTLRDKHLLLVVDNCEHVLVEAARVADPMDSMAYHALTYASAEYRLARVIRWVKS